MSLRLRLMAAIALIITLPFAALTVLARVTGPVIPGEPMLRYVRLNRTALSHIDVPAEGSPSLRNPGGIPPWLGLALFSTDGLLIDTNLVLESGVAPVDGVSSFSEFAEILREEYPNRRYVLEPIMYGGVTRGSYLALFRARATVAVGGVDRPAWLILVLAAALVFVVLAGIVATVVVGRFGSAVARLERAAEGISRGDLDTPVIPRGTSEIASLGRALDRMRESLREERDRRVRFIAAVSHDLRTPLTSIAGYIEALEDGVASDPETTGRFLAVMREKTKVLDRRIADLLDFAKVSTGEWRARLEAVPLRRFLEDLAGDFAVDADSLDMKFAASILLPGEPVVFLDRSLAYRALENVVSNAFRYCAKGGAVRMEARSTGRGVEVTVADDGPGILPADLPRVFDPYYRGTQSRREEGSGLGLYITRSIAVSHGWAVEIESAPGKGTAVRFVIPLTQGVPV